MSDHVIVRCLTCKEIWDLDGDPAPCLDTSHVWELVEDESDLDLT